MRTRRNLLLIVIAILGMLVTLGLQGCGNDDDAVDDADVGEMPADPAMNGEMLEDPMMDAPPMDEAPPAADPAAAPGGPDARQLTAEGMAAKHDGDYVTARQKFEAAVEADDSHADAHWGLAWVYAEMAHAGQQEMAPRAIEQFEKFLELGGTQEQVAEATSALDRLR